MYLIAILSENQVVYLQPDQWESREDGRDAARELSRDYPLSVVRLFRLGDVCAYDVYQNGKDITYA